MDTEEQPSPPHENGSKIQESTLEDPPGETATSEKDPPSTPPKSLVARETRSRSRTPQKKKDKKTEENVKTSLTKIDENSKIQESTSEDPQSETTTNGNDGSKTPPKSLSRRKTRSRSKTPQKKKEKKPEENLKTIDESMNGHEKKKQKKKNNKEENKAVEEIEDISKNNGTPKGESISKEDKSPKELKKSPKKPHKGQDQPSEVNGLPNETESVETSKKKNKGTTKAENEGVEMDPLIIASDEPDPELQFDENSDMDSGKGSPILARCKTRRSHTRNIPTPKTPKSATDSESEKNSVAPTPTPENLNETNDSLNVDELSTKAEVGSDATRLDYMANNTSILSGDNSYLNYSRDKSLRDTLRSLSPRKTIRPLNDSYRQRAFRNNLNKSDLNLQYSEQDSVDRITGLKRKRSVTPEERKKFKSDSAGFVSYLSSPISNFKSRFVSDISSSTPKLTGYKDDSKDIHEQAYTEVVSEEGDKKNWCAIM